MRTERIDTAARLDLHVPSAHTRLVLVVAVAAFGLTGCNSRRHTKPTGGSAVVSVKRVLLQLDVDANLAPVFAHSLSHSLISALQSNGVQAVIGAATVPGADSAAQGVNEAEGCAPDATMHVTVKPLYRTRADGYRAIVGTDFKAGLIDAASGKRTWKTTGKVDYIKRFGPGYTASAGIRKEFAWHTTAAIVREFVAEVNGQEPAPIHTVTEARQRHGQRVD